MAKVAGGDRGELMSNAAVKITLCRQNPKGTKWSQKLEVSGLRDEDGGRVSRAVRYATTPRNEL